MLRKLFKKIKHVFWKNDEIECEEWPILSRRAHCVQSSGVELNFTLLSATGGKIIQVQSYDKVKDENIYNLYIIHDTDNLGEEIDLIITRERLS